MHERTYSPLPAWPLVAVPMAMFLAPGHRARLILAQLAAGYVIGPAVGYVLHRIAARPLIAFDDNLAEFPTDEGEA